LKRSMILGVLTLIGFANEEARSDNFKVKVCNDYAQGVQVAVSSLDAEGSPVWATRGWYHVPASSCRGVGPLDGFVKGYLYLYAETKRNGVHWGGNKPQCVKYEFSETTWVIYIDASKGSNHCPQSEIKYFAEFLVDTGLFTWKLGSGN
jgi:uncharacterized membrane protein